MTSIAKGFEVRLPTTEPETVLLLAEFVAWLRQERQFSIRKADGTTYTGSAAALAAGFWHWRTG